MKSNFVEETPQLTERTIILLDGRKETIHFFRKHEIVNHDNILFILHFNIFEKENRLHYALANILIDLLTTHSITYVATITRAFKHLFKFNNISTAITLDPSIINSLQTLNINYYPFIPPILRRLAKYSPNLIDPELINFLENSEKWEERSPAYFKLIVNDPEKGAFTLQELENLHNALNLAFSQNKISLKDYTLAWFVSATGVRPVQLSRLTYGDLEVIQNDVMLKIPLAKAEGIVDQGYFLRKAPTILADCIIRYLNEFPNSSPSSSFFKLNPTQISRKFQTIFETLTTYSSRLEERIPVNAYRFRYTLATRALAHGASDHEIARLLTHRSIHCIRFYRASMPELQKPIQDALAEEMGFFATAFQGKLIGSLNEASIQDSVIADFFHLAGKSIGSCGTHAKCYQNAPIACLTCPYFEPLLDAPWNSLLQYLIDDQTQESSLRIKEINQQAIKAINDITSLIKLRRA